MVMRIAHLDENNIVTNISLSETLPDGSVEAADANIGDRLVNGAFVKYEPSAEDVKTLLAAQILALEAGQARAVREAALGSPAYLQAIETQIVTLRAQLQ